MKKFLAIVLMLGVCPMFVGCDNTKTKDKKEEKVSTEKKDASGTTKTESTKTEEDTTKTDK